MRNLWATLHDLFDTDDGSLPDIFIENLTGDQVSEIYRWVRSKCGVYSDEWNPTFWDRVDEQDVPVTSVDDPASLVVNGRAESFRHGLSEVSSGGVVVPSLTIVVWPNSIEFDYRMGPEWGPTQLDALFDFLWGVQQLASTATISHSFEGCSDRSTSFADAWNRYKVEKSAT
jgi:hypothetical protein